MLALIGDHVGRRLEAGGRRKRELPDDRQSTRICLVRLLALPVLLGLLGCSSGDSPVPDTSTGKDIVFVNDKSATEDRAVSEELTSDGSRPEDGGELSDVTVEIAGDIPLPDSLDDLPPPELSGQETAVPDSTPEVEPQTPVEGAIEEEFDDEAMNDDTETSALWGIGGVLQPAPVGFGDGSDGALEPVADTVLDTAQAPYNFTTLHIPAGVTVSAGGDGPLELLVQGEALVEGTITVDGGDGADALGVAGGLEPGGGQGVAGGADGGAGSSGGSVPGHAGAGQGSGQGGITTGIVTFVGCGGGGGFGSAGEHGHDWSLNDDYSGAGGPANGDEELLILVGGSGGGGGGPLDKIPGDPAGQGNGVVDPEDKPGAGGGAGGGIIVLRAGGAITLSGRISADGGMGGMGDFSGGGGGGSGGAVLIETAAQVVLHAGVISALGGKGNVATDSNQLKETVGGAGGGGRVVVRTGIPLDEGIVLDPDPVPSWGMLDEPVNGGTGQDGEFSPGADIELDTNMGPYFYSSVAIPAGVTITASGSEPLIIHSVGGMDIEGTIDIGGLKGTTAYSACCNQPGPPVAGVGGAPGPGGFRGGDGSGSGDAETGYGYGGGSGSHVGGSAGSPFAGGGGGAGYGTTGQVGGCPEEAPGGEPYGDPELSSLLGGSGGGGAGYNNVAGDNPGSGGGGGGGALKLQAGGMMLLSGTIRTNGGEGGDNAGSGNGGSFGSGGGGGSGGAILVRALSVRAFGKFEAVGGKAGYLPQGGGCVSQPDVPGQGRGGRGGKGRIRFETGTPLGFVYKLGGSLFLGDILSAFSKIGVSQFYDTGTECPGFGEVEVFPPELTGKVAFKFEGAHDSGGVPDPATATGWHSTTYAVDCHRYIRFAVEFADWPQGSPIPELDKVVIPYTYLE